MSLNFERNATRQHKDVFPVVPLALIARVRSRNARERPSCLVNENSFVGGAAGERAAYSRMDLPYQRTTVLEKILQKSARILLVTILLFSLALLFIAYLISIGKNQQKTRITDRDIAVHVILHDGTTKDYDSQNFPELKYGDEMILSIAPVGEERAVENGTLTFSLYHCRIKVYVGDKLVYTQVDPPKEQQIGHRYYTIPLPAGYEKQTIRIDAVCSENETTNHGGSYLIVPGTRALYAFTDSWVPVVILMLAVMTFSLLMVILTGVMWVSETCDKMRKGKRTKTKDLQQKIESEGAQHRHSLFFMSMLTFTITVWYMGFKGLLVPLVSNASFLANIEYCAMFFLPIPLVGFMWQEATLHWQDVTSRGLFVAALAFFAVTTWRNFCVPGMNYVNFIRFLRVALAVTLVLSAVILVRRCRQHHVFEMGVALRGFLLSAMLGVAETIRFELSSRIGYRYHFLHTSLMPAVILVLSTTILFYYGMHYTRESYEQIEQESLKRLAYTDQLTGAPNRSACNLLFQKIRDEKITDFVVVFADINFLKRTNDTWGHEKGDELIRTASDLLQRHFVGKDFFGRWGGDEFIAVHIGTMEEARALMDQVAGDLQRINEEKKYDFLMSVSWGFAASTKEQPVTPEDAMLLADSRMYENKKKAHAERST